MRTNLLRVRSAAARLSRHWGVGIYLGVAITSTLAVFWVLHQQSTVLVRGMALQGTELQVKSIEAIRQFYTSEVVATALRQGLEVTHDYEGKPASIPLPATLTIKLGEYLNEVRPGAKVRLYSDYPFPWRDSGGQRDAFERAALQELRRNPEQPFYAFEEFEGRPSLRYAIADRMSANCVSCHNQHPSSPKRDWKIGDVRGVLEFIRPLDNAGPIAVLTARSTLTVWLAISGVAFGVGVFGLGFAIRRLRKTSEDLWASTAYTRTIIDNAAEGIISINAMGIVQTFNSAAEKIFGYIAAEIVGESINRLVPPAEGADHDARIQQYLAAGQGRVNGTPQEVVGRRKDASTFPIELQVSQMYCGDEIIFIALVRDISERAEAQRELSAARDHAEAVNADLVALSETHAALIGCRTITDVARVLTDALVRKFDAHFARVWLLRPADNYCSECTLASHCPTKQECLHLIASSGFYTHIDGPHRRVPLGAFKIGLIAQGAGKMISHDVVHDERVHDRQWAAEQGLRSFVGHPLLRDGRVIGVMAMFSRNDLPEHVLETTEILATVAAAAIANVELIESQHVATQAAETAARTDKLTGLPNRALLLDRVQHALERAKRLPEYHFAVMFLDMDRFKIINDSLGHEFGDTLLQAIAARLRESLRAGDSMSRDAEGTLVGRLGGDEFVVLLDGIKKPEDAATVADRLLKNLEAPYQLGEREVHSTASIGIVCSNAEYDEAGDILRDADIAMYEAKARGPACYVMFDVSMQAALQNRLQIENDLRAAIGEGAPPLAVGDGQRTPTSVPQPKGWGTRADQFSLVYQPIVSLEDGELRGVEALIRWNHPTRGLVLPGEFIPIAEETRLILPLSDWVFEQACAQFVKWRRQAPDRTPAYVSVNLSRLHLAEPNLVEQIIRAVQRAGIEPGQLQLEVTESGIMENREAAKKILRALKAAGIRLAMDDFGTGYSSLSCLHEFPFDVLKIDRSFIINFERGREFIALTHSVVTLAEYLGMTCVAEGVENLDQIAPLQSMGCTCAQGYYFAKPMSAEALIDGKWIDAYRFTAVGQVLAPAR